MKKVYITGTTRGLGKALEDRYVLQNYQVVGLNRPGYNLSNIQPYVKDDFDTYIINAHYGYAQVDLLYELFEANKDRACDIIVIGSVSADGDRKQVNQYAIQKKALDAACTQLQLVKSRCRITQVKLGRMDTDLVSHIDARKMKPKDIAHQIYLMDSMNQNNCFVKTITIDIKE